MKALFGSSTFLLITLILVFVNTSEAQSGDTFPVASISPDAFDVMLHFYSYDQGVPLGARVVDTVNDGDYVRDKVVFSGPKDSRVPGYISLPTLGTPPFPVVLLMHGIGSSKEDWWNDDSFPSGGHLTTNLLESGFAVMALDAEYHGERLMNNDFESPMVFTFEKGWMNRTRDMMVQSVVEYRRAIDYLGTRGDIDTERIGVVGFSMGGMMTFILTAVDPRVKVSVASVTPILKESHSAIAVHNFAPFIASTPFLMLMGENDSRNYSQEDARSLHSLIRGDQKDLVFYESGHQLPVEWTRAATQWMENHLR